MKTEMQNNSLFNTSISGIGGDISAASISSIDSFEITITDIGIQGLPGAQGPLGPVGPVGPSLQFEELTEQQKIELRGDVGNTSTNYTNLFNSVLLS